MNTTWTCIQGGRVYDPTQSLDGHVGDIWLHAGRIVPPPVVHAGSQDTPTTQNAKAPVPPGRGGAGGAAPVAPTISPSQVHKIDARGMAVMAGGVEVHSHLVSMSTFAARRIQSETGYHAVVPSAVETGRRYARLGYTTGIEAAIPPAAAGCAHMHLDAVPSLDTGFLLLLGNHEAVIERLQSKDQPGALAIVQHMLRRAGALGIKAVNPGGVAAWRRDPKQTRVNTIDQRLPELTVTPRSLVELFTEAQESLNLAHPMHLHGPQLGEPGNVTITLEMLQALSGRRAHLAHLQYYAYGKNKKGGFKSDAGALAGWLAAHPEHTADLGLVAFGPAFTATADLPLEYDLYRHVGQSTLPAWFCETGNEDGFGVMPLVHKAQSPSHAMQWATGLELALSVDNLWQTSLTIDHPNGGSFEQYPHLISLLMSSDLRRQQLEQAHQAASRHTGLAGMSRELSLYEIAILTRAAPARSLGMADRGTLRPGAEADVAVYRDQPDREAMFSSPAWVLKRGQVVVRDGVVLADSPTHRLRAALKPTEAGEAHYARWHALRSGSNTAFPGVHESQLQTMQPIARSA